jgi:serine/threonine protein kinase
MREKRDIYIYRVERGERERGGERREERRESRERAPQISFVWTEGRLADLARKMLSAVAYLHQRGIAHRL